MVFQFLLVYTVFDLRERASTRPRTRKVRLRHVLLKAVTALNLSPKGISHMSMKMMTAKNWIACSRRLPLVSMFYRLTFTRLACGFCVRLFLKLRYLALCFEGFPQRPRLYERTQVLQRLPPYELIYSSSLVGMKNIPPWILFTAITK